MFAGTRQSDALIFESTAFDFTDAKKILRGLTFTVEDDRESYGEQRFITLGLLEDQGGVSDAH